MKPRAEQYLAYIFICLLVFVGSGLSVSAQSRDNIKDEIQRTSQQIEELDDEINELSGDLEHTYNEAATLGEAVSQLDSSVQNLSTQVNQTQSSISSTQSRIATLVETITEIEQDMQAGKKIIAQTIRILQQAGDQTLVEALLSADSLADAWGQVDQLGQLQIEMRNQLRRLEEDREVLIIRQAEAKTKRQELSGLQEQYLDQRAIIASQKEEKAELLQATNLQANQYEALITQKQVQREIFEAQMREFEAQLESSGAAVPEGASQFVWPVSPVIITQQFGGTEFAKQNPQVYGRPFHNGTDFGVSVGTPVASVAAGTVRASGNTDAYAGCYSYGKWILVDHNNGLSTLYAHLSRIASSPGQRVAQGERIGYSGNTGYSTGPHLHLTTYLQPDVRVVALGEVKTRTNCAAAQMPVAPLESYLDSMTYLP
ncbi:MAG: peptidoglycan DD-metalloendopeptidase family protein [Candidatus Paceibacterota bacterium]